MADEPGKRIPGKDGLTGKAVNKIGENNETVQKTKKAVDDTKKAVGTTKTVGLGALKVGKVIGVTLMPPWGPVIWIIVITAIIAGYLAYGVHLSTGRNDNRDVCADDSSVSNQIGSISMDSTEREIAQEIGDYLTSNSFSSLGGPMSVEQAAGLIGNMVHESAGLRPYVREGNVGDNSLYSNSEVRQWRISQSGSVEGSNAAIGLAQWDGARAEALIQFAEDNNTQWYEFDLQLEYLAAELNGEVAGGYEASLISANSAIQSDSSSVDNYVVAFQDTFYRPAAQYAHTSNRTAAAAEFLEYYSAGAYSGSHGHIICNDASNLAVGEIADTAMQMAWEWENVDNAKASCSWNTNGGRPCGKDVSKPEYIEGKEAAEANTGADPLGDLYASCDRFVATVLRVTGVDENVPWGSAATQTSHFNNSSNWSEQGSGSRDTMNWNNLRPGDVLANNTHVAIYIGKVNGEDFVAHSSIQAPFQNNGNGMTGYQSSVSALGSTTYQAFRHTG